MNLTEEDVFLTLLLSSALNVRKFVSQNHFAYRQNGWADTVSDLKKLNNFGSWAALNSAPVLIVSPKCQTTL